MATLRRSGMVFILLMGFSSLIFAATSNWFDKGMQAFRSTDYATAAQAFEQARTEGMDVPALYYNLGVSYYRLGRLDKSEQMFLRTSHFTEMAPLAFYNLGLVKLKQNDEKEARRWFTKASDLATDPRLKDLAGTQLEKPKPAEKAWSAFVSAGLGYDSNVTLDNDTLTSVSSQSDTFMEFFGFTRGVLSGTANDGVILKASLFGDFYRKLTDYNLVEANGGLYKTFSLGGWNNEAGGYLTTSTLGSEGYLQSANLSLATQKTFTNQFRLGMKLRLRSVRAIDSHYEYVDGSTSDFSIDGRWKLDTSSQLRLTYQLEVNDREGLETVTSFTSLSPTRNRFKVDYSVPLTPEWTMKLAGEYRNSRYAEDNIESDGSTIARNDNRLRGQVELARFLNRNTSLALGYSYTDNRSNISRYDYSKNVLMANIQLLF
jgi:tetratricopeptide (TPR) repeat protein